MRIYLSPELSKLLSMAGFVLSLGLLFLIINKAIQTWKVDPNLKAIPAILHSKDK